MDIIKLFATAGALFFCSAAIADSTVMGLGAGGLEFRATDKVSMVKELLTISPQKIDAQYVFKNVTAQPVELLVAFPLPVIDFSKKNPRGPYTNIPNPNQENFVEFHTRVNGQPVHTQVDTKALVGDRDVSSELKKLGISYWIPGHGFNEDRTVQKQLAALSQSAQRHLEKTGVIELGPEGDDSFPYPRWRLVTLYYWTQTFPVGQDVNIQHVYRPLPSLSEGFSSLLQDANGKPVRLLAFNGSPEARYPKGGENLKEYCMTDGFWKLAQSKKDISAYQSSEIDFILKTANAWHKPIGEFTLVIQTLQPETLVSICIEGIKQTGPTSFTVTKYNFAPTQDIRLFFLVKKRN
jgi:hypothetical protein